MKVLKPSVRQWRKGQRETSPLSAPCLLQAFQDWSSHSGPIPTPTPREVAVGLARASSAHPPASGARAALRRSCRADTAMTAGNQGGEKVRG